MSDSFDLLVIGGGINGASVARAAAVAGHRVLLVEQGDLAQGTSSASTKLIHGGLRYLEHFEFKLVRESLNERAIMLRTAPHIVRPLPFLLPHDRSMRPWLMVRAGLLLYDALALRGPLPRSRSVKTGGRRDRRGFSYWDARVDDSRLVVLNALDAFEAGATILTRARMARAHRQAGEWRVRIEMANGGTEECAARAIVNAGGPWVDEVLREAFGRPGDAALRLVRGSHIVIARKPDDDRALLLQQPDGRIVFSIPYEGDLTLIGTTDIPVEHPEDAYPSDEEIAYLLAAANRYLEPAVAPSDIVWRFGGIRALYDDGTADPSAVTRDYRLELIDDDGPPLLSVYGGKVTTARHLAEIVLKRLDLRGASTRDRFLPGGDIGLFSAFLADVRRQWPFLGNERSERMASAYGSRIGHVLAGAGSVADLGRDFGHGLTEREVAYLFRAEWARSADDILWRRTKLGLRLSADEADFLDRHMRALCAEPSII